MPRTTPLKQYLTFVKSTWGALANVSLLFPFSVHLLQHASVSPKYSMLCTVLCVAALFIVWVGRADSWLFEIRAGALLNLVVVSTGALLLGSLCLFLFFQLHGAGGGEDLQTIPLYLGGFMGLTVGFAGLGLKEFFLTSKEPAFEFRDMADRVIAIHLDKIAKTYLHCNRRELFIAERHDGEGARLLVRRGNDEFELEIGATGHLKYFRAKADVAAPRPEGEQTP